MYNNMINTFCCLGYVFHMLGVHSSWLIYLFLPFCSNFVSILRSLLTYPIYNVFNIIVLYIIIEANINSFQMFITHFLPHIMNSFNYILLSLINNCLWVVFVKIMFILKDIYINMFNSYSKIK